MSLRLGWTTDVHLNFVNLPQWESFLAEVREARLSGLLITGDISEADDVVWHLKRLAAELQMQLYFVLGNHDFYSGSIAAVRRSVRAVDQSHENFHYLTGSSPVLLSDEWVLCGDDGWADARAGDMLQSPIRMNDFRLIDDLQGLTSLELRKKLRREGTHCAVRLSRQLSAATEIARNILVLTHVPPFRESCWYEGRTTDDDWAPFFVCQAVGWALKRFCKANPQHNVLVLCGHTHHSGHSQLLKNLVVWTGAAEYGAPRLATVLDFEKLDLNQSDWRCSP